MDASKKLDQAALLRKLDDRKTASQTAGGARHARRPGGDDPGEDRGVREARTDGGRGPGQHGHYLDAIKRVTPDLLDKLPPALREKVDALRAGLPDIEELKKARAESERQQKTAEATSKAARGQKLSSEEQKLLDAGTKAKVKFPDVRKDPVGFVKAYEKAMLKGDAKTKQAAYEAMRQAIRDFPEAVKEGLNEQPIPDLIPQDLKGKLAGKS